MIVAQESYKPEIYAKPRNLARLCHNATPKHIAPLRQEGALCYTTATLHHTIALQATPRRHTPTTPPRFVQNPRFLPILPTQVIALQERFVALDFLKQDSSHKIFPASFL